jgi:hypothetical protein
MTLDVYSPRLVERLMGLAGESPKPAAREVTMRRTAAFMVVVGAAAALAAPAGAAGNPFGVDYHANCTGGFAVSQTLGGDPGATELSVISQPPKQFGNLSDTGFFSSTNCA